ncbi:MAG TPA: TlpA disulfide reductase family protein [Candidatus Solibacter sp.]|jgi:cytochrome c biogenesis protein CcmG/thiol:disulfide interchange protein DsbE|nr:TlpA disulfide reductase family protein [Candidatus Solibacter sp.]
MRIWLAALSAALTLGACGLPGTSSTTSASAGNPAPAFDLVGVDGARHSLSSFRGRVVVLNFWATWCIPCRAEMPDLEHEARIHSGGPVAIVGVDWKESAAQVTDFTSSLGVSYPMLLDSDGQVYARYRVAALPTTFIIDARGSLLKSRVGIASRDEVEAEIKAAQHS